MSLKYTIKMRRLIIAIGALLSSGVIMSEANAQNSFSDRVKKTQKEFNQGKSISNKSKGLVSFQDFGNTGFQNGFFNGFANGWCSGPGCQ